MGDGSSRAGVADHVNEVHVVGRVSNEPESRVLPSGETVTMLRLVVSREGAPARPTSRARTPTVDTLECAAWTASARRMLSRWHAGDTVEVNGCLRRRFWRSPAGVASRYEIEVVGGSRRCRADGKASPDTSRRRPREASASAP